MSDGNHMAEFVSDILTSHAVESKSGDFCLRVEGNQIAYVDVEGGTVWLITINEAKFMAASDEPA